MSRAVPVPDDVQRETLWKTLQTFGITRIVIAAVLFAYLSISTAKGFRAIDRQVMQATCAFYLLASVGFAIFSGSIRRRFTLQLLFQLSFDIAVTSALYVAGGGVQSGLAILYLFPLAGGAILAPSGLALFLASMVTLIMLTESGLQIFAGDDSSTMQAGLYGAAFFIIVFAINRLAARLLKQEGLALERGRNLRIQEAINRLIIKDMDDGVAVIGRDGTLLTLNPAAERMLGLSDKRAAMNWRLQDMPHLAPIDMAFRHQLHDAAAVDASDAGQFVILKFPTEIILDEATASGARREPGLHLKLRFAPIEYEGIPGDRTVLFLQDVSEIENRAQQLKLASMGRLTASIAHEVRNPLSAISHAAGLLDEDAADPVSKRLISIVLDNVGRLNRMIEDILGLSRKAQRHGEPLVLRPAIERVIESLVPNHASAGTRIDVIAPAGLAVRFDPLHFHEVLVNLLSNAFRYASQRPGSIRIQAVGNPAGRLELHVQDDGPAISPEVRSHLFEPFYTTSSKGTGLGLYLARELCLNNGAMLDYEYRLDGLGDMADNPSGRFVITFDMFDLP